MVERLYGCHTDTVGVHDSNPAVRVPEPERGREILRHRPEVPNTAVIESVGPHAHWEFTQSGEDIVCAYRRPAPNATASRDRRVHPATGCRPQAEIPARNRPRAVETHRPGGSSGSPVTTSVPLCEDETVSIRAPFVAAVESVTAASSRFEHVDVVLDGCVAEQQREEIAQEGPDDQVQRHCLTPSFCGASATAVVPVIPATTRTLRRFGPPRIRAAPAFPPVPAPIPVPCLHGGACDRAGRH